MAGAAPAAAGDAPAAERPDSRGWVAAASDATEVALFRPAAWPVALAGFLVRGGLVAFVLPIVVLPTVTGLTTALGPVIILLALAGANPTVVPLIASVAATLLVWFLVGGLVGASADVVLVRWFGSILGGRLGRLDDRAPGRAAWGQVWRVFVVRSIALLPLAPALGWALIRVVVAVYREVTTPGDVTAPLVLRVVEAVPDALILLGLAWLVSEAVGALAVRWVVLGGRGVLGSFVGAGRSIVSAPIGLVATAILATGGSILLIVPPLLLSSWTWDAARRAVLGEPGPGVILVPTVLVIVWFAGLALAGLASAWRSALWTAEVLRTGGRRPTRVH